METIAVIGEVVADAVTVAGDDAARLRLEVRPGGSPANTAVALARLGTPTRFFGRLSRGVLGRMLRAHLERSTVDLSHAVPVDREASLAIAALDDAGRADYDFYVDGTADWQWHADELAAAGSSAIIHTGSLALVRGPSDEVIADTLRRHRVHSTISIDPNVRPGIASAARYRRGLEKWAGLADVLKLSREDLEFAHPGADRRRLCAHWHELGCRLIVVTLAEHGSVASLDGEEVWIPGREVRLADTIGAGDAFTAGLLHHLVGAGHHGGRLERLDIAELTRGLQLADLVAARTCEVPGADPPWGTPA